MLGVVAVAGAIVALSGCAVPPADASAEPDMALQSRKASTASTAPTAAGAGNSGGTGLKPLVREIAVPPGAPPRSTVARVNYELSSSGSDLPPDDGLPGDDAQREIFQRGGASWYGIQFHRRQTANGERFDMTAFTAAHRTLPFGTVVCVRSLVNGREVLVRVNDRGPYGYGRIIDLSRAAADSLDMLNIGIKQVALTVIDAPEMRCNGAVADTNSLGAPDDETQEAMNDSKAKQRRIAQRRKD